MSDLRRNENKSLVVMRRILAAIGILIMALSGGCSLLVLLMGAAEFGTGLPTILVVGGVPFAIGYLFWRVSRERPKPPETLPPDG